MRRSTLSQLSCGPTLSGACEGAHRARLESWVEAPGPTQGLRSMDRPYMELWPL